MIRFNTKCINKTSISCTIINYEIYIHHNCNQPIFIDICRPNSICRKNNLDINIDYEEVIDTSSFIITFRIVNDFKIKF